ncbi:hypothetical protein MMC12_004771 [Toensbergia leucococca]|nr:hypothetical protein [Toensbergia leucococca]
MILDTQTKISIAELAFYVPAFVATVILLLRHGNTSRMGWIFLMIFMILRFTGAGMEISSADGNTSITTASLIVSSIGISPLLLSTQAILKNASESSRSFLLSSWVFLALHINTILALGLTIAGAEDLTSANTDNTGNGRTLTRVGVLIFLAVLTVVTFLTILSFRTSIPSRLLYAIALSLPVLFVRIIYSICVYFSSSATFSFTGGNAIVELCMAILMEFIVVIIYIVGGYSQRATSQNNGPQGAAPLERRQQKQPLPYGWNA